MEILIGIVILVLSAIAHEYMHGFVAEKLGDPTARLAGRLTLNPIPHIDPVMSILVPVTLVLIGSPIVFAAAKPVPVNPLNLRDGRKDLALVALAGPLTNFVLAIIAAILLKIGFSGFIGEILFLVVLYNVMLAIFNLIPIPPLDGSKFFSLVLPEKIAYQYLSIAPFGIFIVLALMYFPIGGFSLGDLMNRLVIFTMQILGVV